MVRRRTQGQHSEGPEAGENPQDQEAQVEESASPRNGPSGEAGLRRRNGLQGTAAADHEQTPSPAMQRAEEMVDHLAERVGHYAGVFGHQLLWLAARAREEAEDIWAEAQALRRGEKPH
jgi:hypothetical protein